MSNRSDIVEIFLRLRLIIGILSLIAIGLLRLFLFKDSDFSDLFSSLFEAIFISIAIFTFAQFSTAALQTPPFDSQHTTIIPNGKITGRSRSNAHSADRWEYIGHIGRHTRTVVFNALSERASSRGISCSIDILLISPFSQSTIDEYCKHSNSSQKQYYTKSVITPDDIREEIFATIIKCRIMTQNNPNFKINLFISDFFSTFRYDVSPNEILITQEDPFSPALAVQKDSSLFYLFEKECSHLKANSKSLALSDHTIKLDDITSIQLFLNDTFSTHVCNKIIEGAVRKIRQGRNPYAG